MKGSRGPGASEDLSAALSAAQESRTSPKGWAWYDRKTDEAHRRAFRLLTDLKSALDAEDQLELHYQPKISLGSGACLSAEALLRWTHPELGPVSPAEFVALAETTALVTPLTRWVVGAATSQAARWAHGGLELTVAVNISPKNLEEPDFVEYLLFCCAANRLDRAKIELEITEGVSAARGGLILDRLAALRQLGFSIAIDDFGSGYSNMSYLTRLSAQTLKIDQSLVRGVAPDTPGRPPRRRHRPDGPRPRLPGGRRGHRDRGGARARHRLGLRRRPGLALRPADAGRRLRVLARRRGQHTAAARAGRDHLPRMIRGRWSARATPAWRCRWRRWSG